MIRNERTHTMTEMLTVQETSSILRIHPRTLLRWRREGRGPFCIRLDGGQLRFPADELESYLVQRYRDAIQDQRERVSA